MYCIQCGVRLADTESKCPLCQTRVYHPEIHRPQVQPLYPQNEYPSDTRSSRALPISLTVLCITAALVVLLCDLQLHRKVTWSGYVIGALVIFYVALALPLWFRRPNPVIFTPCTFAAVAVYLLYIDLMTAGSWFLTFAFPVTGGVGLILTAMVTLLRYVHRGKLYIAGGGFLASGTFMVLIEFLLKHTFGTAFIGWSLYPLTALVLLGGFLIFLGICRPAREAMERKVFF
ncbi:MAG: hypothetical protein IJO45_02445 [Oscillospiraceae bacterium]|nr:hypothetical protein [Oscillospiraceae bacterium]